ncbi:MAG: DUF1553 domain-containing protein [Pirellulaceae bacterium]
MRWSLCRIRNVGWWMHFVCIVAVHSVHAADGPAPRIDNGLIAAYSFVEPTNAVITDDLNAAEALRIHSPQAIQYQDGGMAVHASAMIVSDTPPQHVIAAVKKSNALSVEVWLQPADLQQKGPARIFSISDGPSARNMTLGQDGDRFDVRLRTSSTDQNGMPSLASQSNAVSTERTHVVFTRNAQGNSILYINGQENAAKQQPGSLENWDEQFRMAVANEVSGDRPWRGHIFLLAIYDRSLSATEVQQNFSAGIPGGMDYNALLPEPLDRSVDFVKDIQPLLKDRCFDCHVSGNEEGGLNLGIRQRVVEGGEHGPILIQGDSQHSRMIHMVAGLDDVARMPPDGEGDPLTDQEVSLLRTWIDQGMPWPDGTDILDPRMEEAKTHWAFQPLHAVTPPDVQHDDWVRSPVDRFVLAKLEAAELSPSERVDARRLIRRLYFDLIGLPPSPEQVDEFVEAANRDWDSAVESLVDSLLASSHYGERWGRHWLDVARYADSDGQESDRDRPAAYHYRDFVIQAFNDDMPFDQFVRWQLAGDEIEPNNPQAFAATGFIVAGPFAALPDRLMEDERLRNRYNELDDVLSTVGTGMLGLTLGCCRCHDHKYDAIPSRDYYRLLSAFHTGERAELKVGDSSEKIFGFAETRSEPAPTWLFARADYYDRDQPVQLGFVSVMTSAKTPDIYWRHAKETSQANNSTNQRHALADWMTDEDDGAGPLVARVFVNRLWHHHFRHGLVRTTGDFGVRSEPPTHPELLEWLARDFVSHGWKVKRLQRMMVLSAVYLQASGKTPPDVDPQNRLLSFMPLRRLEAEILRDSLLSVSGTLNKAQFGPAVRAPIAAEAILARNLKDGYPKDIKDGPEVRRRSVYMFHKRVVPNPLLAAFDKPDAQQSCSRRDVTTVAPQALALLNDPFVRTVALEFADRLMREAAEQQVDATSDQTIDRAFQLSLGRHANERELTSSRAFVQQQIRQRHERTKGLTLEQATQEALADFCQVLFGLNEFLYVD